MVGTSEPSESAQKRAIIAPLGAVGQLSAPK